MYTMQDKFMIGALIVQFLLIAMTGTFSAHAVGAWLTNKREERKVIRDQKVDAAQRRADIERNHWANLLKDRDQVIADQAAKIAMMERRVERMEDLLTASEAERRRLMEGKA